MGMESHHFSALLGQERGERIDRVVNELNGRWKWQRWVPISVWVERRRGTSSPYVFARVGGQKRYLGSGLDLKEAFEEWVRGKREHFAQHFAGCDMDADLDVEFEVVGDEYIKTQIMRRVHQILRARGLRPHRMLRGVPNVARLLKVAADAKAEAEKAIQQN